MVEQVVLRLGEKLDFLANSSPYPNEGVKCSRLCLALGLDSEETRDGVIAASLVALFLSTSKLPILVGSTSPHEKDTVHKLPKLISAGEHGSGLPQRTKDALKEVLATLAPVATLLDEKEEHADLIAEMNALDDRARQLDLDKRRCVEDLLRKRRRLEDDADTELSRLVEDAALKKELVLRAQKELDKALLGKEVERQPFKRQRRCRVYFW